MVKTITTRSKLGKRLSRYFNLDKKLRGEYLGQATFVESFMTDIIAEHFQPFDSERQSLLISLVLSEISFASKARIFSYLIKEFYPEIKNKYPDLIKNLDEIRNFRNKLAHYLTDSTISYVEKTPEDRIRFEFHKDGKKQYLEITKTEFNKRLDVALEVTDVLAEIWDNFDKIVRKSLKKKKRAPKGRTNHYNVNN